VNRIGILRQTIEIFNKGSYFAEDSCVELCLKPSEYAKAIWLSEKEVRDISDSSNEHSVARGNSLITVSNRDSFEAAVAMKQRIADNEQVLVLNFANPIYPGGGVRYGASAQEEDLCRKSSLLLSLESPDAAPFYLYHKNECDSLSSDSMLLSPAVEVIRDKNNKLLSKSEVVSVITCAAPIRDGVLFHPISQNDYYTLLYERIKRILIIAANYQYSFLVLGAWGCGSFGNDAQRIAKLFNLALNEYIDGNNRRKDLFKEIEFAVLSVSTDFYNYQSFYKEFCQIDDND